MTIPSTTSGCCDETDDLRKKIDQRIKDCQNPPHHCRWIDLTAGYALAPYSEHDEPAPNLLVPTECIKGIECPIIRDPNRPNYWRLAWEQLANEHWKSHLGSIGMAINSADAGMRHFNQLHTHVRRIDGDVQDELDRLDGKIGSDWSIQTIHDPKAKEGHPHQYRVRRLSENGLANNNPNLFQRVFDELKKEHKDPAGNMQHQTLVVAQRKKGKTGFYVLNSDRVSPSLSSQGVGDGERLLYPPP